ncbi:cysteine hydrolase family protein, partial [Bacillus sp. HC-Mk]
MTNQIALIIIDVQKAFQLPDWGERNNIFAEENMSIFFIYMLNMKNWSFP